MFKLSNLLHDHAGRFLATIEMIVFGLLLIGMILFIAMQFPRWYAVMFPGINQVHLEGYFLHIDRFEIEKIIADATENNLFEVDLAELKHNLEKIGWVKNVRIDHFTPQTLKIIIEEYEGVARWSNDYLIDTEGEIFKPQEFHPTNLPRLDGKPGREKALLAMYRMMNERLRTIGLAIQILQENDRRSLRLILDNGLLLKLGAREHEKRLDRFIIAWKHTVQGVAGQVSCLDFRYLSGFAMGWEKTACYQ